VRFDQGEKELGMKDLEQARKLAPREPGVAYHLGEMKRKLGDLDGAMVQFDAAVKFDKKYAQGHLGRGLVHLLQRRFDEAVADITMAISLDPRLPHAFANRGIAYYLKGEKVLAEKDFASAEKLDPTIREEVTEFIKTLQN
jgi:lipoprotein NlpI